MSLKIREATPEDATGITDVNCSDVKNGIKWMGRGELEPGTRISPATIVGDTEDHGQIQPYAESILESARALTVPKKILNANHPKR